MRTLKFGHVDVTLTDTGTLICWLLYNRPHQPIDAARMMGVERSTAIKRVQAAAERLPDIHLAVALRENTHWERGVATYKPAVRR